MWTNRVEPGRYETVQATARLARDPMGCILTERFSASTERGPYEALDFINFGHAEAVERMALDSLHGQFLVFTGAAFDQGVRFTWISPKDGGRLQVRHDLRSIRSGSFQTRTDLSTDGGVTWLMVQRAEYRRSG